MEITMERVNDTILLAGRLLMASVFLTAGIPKVIGFINKDAVYTGYLEAVAGAGLPLPEVWALVGIAIEVLGSIALILGILPRIVSLLLIAFVIAATAIAHRFWVFAGAEQQAQLISFLKNLGLIGGLLFYFVSGPGAFSLAGRTAGAGMVVPARA
jgi:putative oxidoreductase